MRLGCQSITFRNADPPRPLPEALGAIAAAGFEGVELAATSVDLQAPDSLRALVRQHGLDLVALHLNSDHFDPEAHPQKPVDLPALTACVRACHVPFVLVSGGGKHGADHLAEVLSTAGRAMAAAGATLCYHNHGRELAKDAAWLAAFCAAADPEAVGLAFDLGWATRAGADPLALVHRFSARIRYVHVKDTAAGVWTELGRGEMDLPAVLGAVAELRLPWWVAEQDRAAGDPAESVGVNGAYLRAWRDQAAGRA